MQKRTKFRLMLVAFVLISICSLFIYFKYFFSYEQRNVIRRKIGSVTGQNLSVTIFGYDGKIIKRWTKVQKITTGRDKEGGAERHYTFFYTRENKYVQVPDSVWYVAEEE